MKTRCSKLVRFHSVLGWAVRTGDGSAVRRGNTRRRFAAAVMLAAAAVAAPLQAQTVYNATTEFSITNGNPNGVWSYGWMPTDFSVFHLCTTYHSGEHPGWDSSVAGVWKNLGGTVDNYGVPPGWISLHPGSGEEPCVVRWTSPSYAPARIQGRFLAGDAGTVLVAVRRGADTLWHGVNAGAFDLWQGFAAGDTVDFVVYGGYWAGNTPLEAIITLNPSGGAIFARQGSYSIVETNAMLSVEVLRVGPDNLNVPVTVDYATVDGTARAGEDYEAASGILQFAAGETNKQIAIAILNDALKESEEQFRLVLSNATGGVSLGNSNVVVRIQDNDPGVRFAAENVIVSEGAGVVAVPVLRGDDLNLPFTVDYATVDGSARAGEDYEAASGTLHFAAGETNKQIAITILNDALKEPDQYFRLDLINPTGGVSLGNAHVIFRIQDNETDVRFATENFTVSEAVGVVTVEVLHGDSPNPPFTVYYATADDTARAGEDYAAAAGTLHFAAGETNKQIAIAILNDALKESEEQFRFVLSNPTGGVLLASSNAVIRIEDNDPGVRLITENITVSEGAGVVTVGVLRGDDLGFPFTVDYATADETTHAGEDYVATSGTLHFAAGETNKLIAITILDDSLNEPAELFRLVLSNPTGGVSLVNSNVAIRILSDEAATTRYYVNVNNPNPAFPYMSWASAATNIQDAVDAAMSGDTVLVTNGVYAVGGREVSVEWRLVKAAAVKVSLVGVR